MTVHYHRYIPELWDELSARVASQDSSDAEVRPRAWLLTPAVAAA